jgi:uncharacterized protein (DUF1800 family)
MQERSRALAALTLCATLAGCGGGGSDGGGSTPPPPPTPAISKAEAYRFLNQATLGATEAEAQRLISLGYEAWIDDQFSQPVSLALPYVQQAYARLPPGTPDVTALHADRLDIWFRNALTAPDQLRQRMAFALSETMVVSQNSVLVALPFSVSGYYDTLARDAFGNFRSLMEDVTLHPSMGVYLSMLGNQKPDPVRNIRPDENYARELMQLFTIGLVQLNLDGTVKQDAQGQPLPTYDQQTIEGFAHVYTGWSWAGAPAFVFAQPTLSNQVVPMQAYPEQHDTGVKRVLSYPGAVLTQIPSGQTPERDLDDALDNIFHHPNVAPFIARALIQRLVTSNPSPQYVERVARRFNDNGSGVRGDLEAVVKAILLDTEARSAPSSASAGKLKEPLLRLTQFWRAYRAHSDSGRYVGLNPTALVGQGPLQAPSVFNFFSPFYAPPGEISDQGLVAPEMQIATEYLNTLSSNLFFVYAFCFNNAPIAGCPDIPPGQQADLVTIDVSEEQPLAADSSALVARIGEKLLGGELSSTLAAEARAQVDLVPASNPSLRAAEALHLIATSPEFAVQR